MLLLAGVAWGAADLSVNMAVDRLSLQPGASGADLANITVTLRNDGPDLAAAQVSVTLSPALRTPAGMSVVLDQGTYNPVSGQWIVGLLDAGATAQMLIPAQANSTAAGCLVSEATATFASGSTVGDPDDANKTARLVIGAPLCAQLVVSTRRDDRVSTSCADALQIIRVENRGPGAASDVTLDITRFEVVSPDAFNENRCTGGKVVVPGPQLIELGTIAAGARREYTTGLRDLLLSGPDIEVAYDLHASAVEPDSDLDDNRASGRFTIRRPFDDDDSSYTCIVSGALGGTGLERYLPHLRRLRDRFLASNGAGRMLVSAYYRLSPPLARRMAQHETLRAAVGLVLAPIIYALAYPAVTGSLLGALLLGMASARLRRSDPATAAP